MVENTIRPRDRKVHLAHPEGPLCGTEYKDVIHLTRLIKYVTCYRCLFHLHLHAAIKPTSSKPKFTAAEAAAIVAKAK